MLTGVGVTVMTPKSAKDTQPCAESPRFHICLPGTWPLEGPRVVLNRLCKHPHVGWVLHVWQHVRPGQRRSLCQDFVSFPPLVPALPAVTRRGCPWGARAPGSLSQAASEAERDSDPPVRPASEVAAGPSDQPQGSCSRSVDVSSARWSPGAHGWFQEKHGTGPAQVL